MPDSIPASTALRDQITAALGGDTRAEEQTRLVLSIVGPHLKPTKLTPEEHFWLNVQKTQTCWLWTAAINQYGYGTLTYRGRQQLAHRVAYRLSTGQMPHLELDHLYRVRNCVNPAHLEQVTSRQNTLRGTSPSAVNAGKTHCQRGHEFTPENTRTYRGHRYCRACNRIRFKERIARGPLPQVPCRNCGRPLRPDTKSSTGFLHVSDSSLRCDGRLSKKTTYPDTAIALPEMVA